MKAIIFCLLMSFSAHAATLQLREPMLKELATKSSPTLDEIQLAFLRSELNDKQELENFAPELYGRAGYQETNEKPIIPFIPIFSPVKDAELGVRKKLRHGFTVSTSAATRQQSAVSAGGKYRDVTSTMIHFTLQMDLWKDLFGRLSQAKLKNAEDDRKRAELEQQINKKAYLISLRKLYWAMVANNESMKISKELLKAAELQSSDSVRRFQNSVAETDEVARNKAQVASRRGTISSLEYQRQNLLRQLRLLIPELNSVEVELGEYNIDKTIESVMVCAAQITGIQGIPYDNTFYDETLSLLTTVKSNNRLINARYDDPEVSLLARVKSVGVASKTTATGFRGSYGESWEDMNSHNRTGYELGLNVTVPLGSARESTQKTKELYDEKRLAAMIGRTEANMISVHREIMTNLGLLNQVIEAQKVNSEQLKKRVGYMRKKYNQARASINDLIQDQDDLLTSELVTIETRLAVVNVLLDYLAVYTETPCEFNRI